MKRPTIDELRDHYARLDLAHIMRELEKRQYKKKVYTKEEKQQLREAYLMRSYGITQAQYDEMLKAQDSKCAICGSTEPNSKWGLWLVDHCHKTNKVRGLLCHRCNTGLGWWGDNDILLRKVIDYLNGKK